MGHRQMFICNNYRFRGDWGKVGPSKIVLNIYLKNLKTVKKCGKFGPVSNFYLHWSQMYFNLQFRWTPASKRCNQVPHDRHLVKMAYTKKCYLLQ